MSNGDEECDIRPGTVTPKKLPKQSGGGGHEFVTELPEVGDEGVEYLVLTDIADCETFEGSFAWNAEAECWVQTSGSGGGGGGATYSFSETDEGWQAKRNGTVIFTYVDKDTVDSYRETAKGFEILRNGSVIFSHDEKGSEYEIKDFVDDETGRQGWKLYKDGTAIYTHYETAPKEYVFENTADGWQVKESGVVKFTYTDIDTKYSCEKTDTGWVFKENGTTKFVYDDLDTDTKYSIEKTDDGWVFKENGTTKFVYDTPSLTDSDGTYFVNGGLTSVIGGTTTVSDSAIQWGSTIHPVVNETLIYDANGTVARLTKAGTTGGTDWEFQTITTSPGERRGTRLGAVDDHTDLPATAAAATALGWQTPLDGDFAYVREDSDYDGHLTEYVIQSVDASGNISWAYSHTLNAGNYVLDIYKYGDYPSGIPIPKNPDGSVTLPKDEDTTYDFEYIKDSDGTIIGWQVKNHETGTVEFTYNDAASDTTYDFEDVKDTDGTVIGWRVKNHDTGAIVYTHTDTDKDTTYTFANTADGFRVTDSEGKGFVHVDIQGTTTKVRQDAKNTLFVDADNGDDSNDGLTVATPFKTIQKAINSAPLVATRMAEYPSYYLGLTIYVNMGATEHYKPMYFEDTITTEIRSYSPSKSSYDADTGLNTVFDDTYDTSHTFTIDAERYPHPTVENYNLRPGCIYIRRSTVFLRSLNTVLNQKCASSCCYVGESSQFEIGDSYAASTLNLKHTLTINANTITTDDKTRVVDPVTGEYVNYSLGQQGCEGIGCYRGSRFYFYGKASVGSVATITASNWGVASNYNSDVRFMGRVVINGGYNTAATYGAVYADSCSRIGFEENGIATAGTAAQRSHIFSYGKGAALSAANRSTIVWTNSYNQKEIARAVNPGGNYAQVIVATSGGHIAISCQNAAYLTIAQHTSDTYSRCINATWGGDIEIVFPTTGTATVTRSSNTSQQAICASENGNVTMWGGAGTTLPVITAGVGYAAYNGGKLTYANVGKFSGTTQRAASSGGRIYTGSQSNIGAY